ncbi:nudix hydrolase [Verticillium dahliae VdLs.17]|uniref:Nudix hydrolase n=1 Tax=Verticillium dahliae (strain VdLs.17 / ATCC MYA-4575 / FGSC 10137) TaxID=498257 RepID=G2X8U3_VERDV|nr:nudix hydrolase [Verticillium dahliae VdLs.17]EGY15380.1 nudix hydrolase [Verticillium dahliae VdLs.17]
MSTTASPNPRVGVAAIIANAQGQIVSGKRQGSHGAGTWQLPGGHLEYGESFFACAEREVLEETGLRVRGVKVAAVTNDIFADQGKHYITIFVKCEMEDATAQPEVCSSSLHLPSLQWSLRSAVLGFGSRGDDLRHLEDAGENLFLPLVNLFKEHADIDPLL